MKYPSERHIVGPYGRRFNAAGRGRRDEFDFKHLTVQLMREVLAPYLTSPEYAEQMLGSRIGKRGANTADWVVCSLLWLSLRRH